MPALLLEPAGGTAMIDLWRELTNERDTAIVPDSVVYTYLDAGAERLNRRVGYHLTDDSTTVVLVAGTQEYAVPTDCVDLVWVELNGKLLQKGDVEQWRRDNKDWRNQPLGFPREWAFYGNKLVLLPAPDAATVAAALSPVLRYISTPRSLATYGPEQLSTQDHRVVVYDGVAIWSSSHPDSPVAQMRRDYFEKRFGEEAALIAEQYAARRISR